MIETAVVEADGSMGFAGSYLRLTRPKQWTKNGFVLAGVVFAHEALVVSSVVSALLAFAAFCALSGAVYAANDVLDVEEDRKHPTKRNRPVASGLISPRAATVYAVLLAVSGLALAFFVAPAAVAVAISPWLIVCTGLLTLFLGFSKRRHELAVLGDIALAHRKNLREYSVGLLDEM